MTMIHIKALSKDSKDPCTEYIYLEGVLERMSGNDLVYIKKLPETEGEYPCEVKLSKQKETIPAVFFYWKNGEQNRGLVVELNDFENMVHARAKFIARAPFL